MQDIVSRPRQLLLGRWGGLTAGLRRLVRGRAEEGAWIRPAFLGVMALVVINSATFRANELPTPHSILIGPDSRTDGKMCLVTFAGCVYSKGASHVPADKS